MAFEKVGVRAVVEGVGPYTRDAQKIEQTNKKLGVSAQSAAKQSGMFSKALAQIGTIATGIIAARGLAMIPSVLGNITSTARDLELQMKKAGVVFGDQIGIVQEWADETSKAMGLSRREAMNAAASFADLLIPMQFTREEAAALSTKVVGLSGALSEWSGGTRSAADVAGVLAKAMLGEREQLKTLGISIMETDVQQRLLEKGQKDLTGTMLQQAKAVATQELIFEKSQDAQTAYADGAGTAARKQAELTATIQETKERISLALAPALQSLLSAFLSMAPALEVAARGFEKLVSIVQSLIGWLKENKDVTMALAVAFATLAAIQVAPHLIAIGASAARITSEFVRLTMQVGVTNAAMASLTGMMMGPVGLIAAAAAAVTGFIILQRVLGHAKDAMKDAEVAAEDLAQAIAAAGEEARLLDKAPEIGALEKIIALYEEQAAIFDDLYAKHVKLMAMAKGVKEAASAPLLDPAAVKALEEWEKDVGELDDALMEHNRIVAYLQAEAGKFLQQYGLTWDWVTEQVRAGNISVSAAKRLWPGWGAEIEKAGEKAGDAAPKFDSLTAALKNLQEAVSTITLEEIDLQLQINQMERLKQVMGDAFGAENQAKLDALNARMETLKDIDEEVILRFQQLGLTMEKALGPELGTRLSSALSEALAELPTEQRLEVLLELDQMNLDKVQNVLETFAQTKIKIPVILAFESVGGEEGFATIDRILQDVKERRKGVLPAIKAIKDAAKAATTTLDGAGAAAGGAEEKITEAEQALILLAAAFDAESLSAEEYHRRLQVAIEYMERFNLTAEQLWMTVERSGLEISDFADRLERLVALENLRDQAREAQDAVNALYDSFSKLFARPTKEEAKLRLDIALLRERRAEAIRAGAEKEIIEAIDKEITAIQVELDVRRAHRDVMEAELDLANKSLMADADQFKAAQMLTDQMGLVSEAAEFLQGRLFLSAFALEDWSQQMAGWTGTSTKFQDLLHFLAAAPGVDMRTAWNIIGNPEEFLRWLRGHGVAAYGEGGIVPGPSGKPQVVIAHGGEKITKEKDSETTKSLETPIVIPIPSISEIVRHVASYSSEHITREKDSKTISEMVQHILPSFDQGGIVPGPIGQPQLVVAHGGEHIVPAIQSLTMPINVQSPSMDWIDIARLVHAEVDTALESARTQSYRAGSSLGSEIG